MSKDIYVILQYAIEITRFRLFIEANKRAILAKSRALPPTIESNWNPVGMATAPKAITPNIMVISML